MRILYHSDGVEDICGVKCKTKVVELEDVESHLKDGWHLTPWDLSHDEVAKPDADSNGKLTIDEARFYLSKHGVEIPDGLHWRKVIAMAEEHHNGNSNN